MNSLLLFSLLVFFLYSRDIHAQPNIFKVTDYGAISDGKTDSTKAFMDAWSKACAIDGGVVEVPFGTYYVSSATFAGPCIGQTLFKVKGTIIATSDPLLGKEYWIEFREIDGLQIFGNGTFDGQGASAWSNNKCDVASSSCDYPPVSLKIISVTNSSIRNINSINSKWFHFHLAICSKLSIKNIDIIAPADSPNTDGIHIGDSDNIKIFNSRISTGDDCVSIGDGNTNINVTQVWCGPGHGISIGSLGKYKDEKDVRGITVRNCTFTGTDNGLRIKTWAPSTVSTVVSDVTFADINVDNVENPIIIDQHYCPHDSCSHTAESSIQINGVRFANIKGSSASEVAVNIQCSKSKPCKDIVFSGLDLVSTATGQPTIADCTSADHQFLGPVQVPSTCS